MDSQWVASNEPLRVEVSRGLTLEEAAERRRRKGSRCLPGNPRQVARRNASLPPTALMEKKKEKRKRERNCPGTFSSLTKQLKLG